MAVNMATSMAANSIASKGTSLFLGVCLPCLSHNASKFSVQQLELDKKLLMFFKKHTVLYAYDPNKICKTGDIALIQELPKRMSTSITHKVLEVVYPCGDIVDPITGKLVEGTHYREFLDNKDILMGKEKTAFDYNKAPKRGWQQDKKDFSHRDIYVRYHEFDEGDENENQPYSSFYK